MELKGKLVGLITVKDVLKYQFKVENEEHPRVESDSKLEERLWAVIERIAGWVIRVWNSVVTKRPTGLNDGPVLIEDEVELMDQPS